MGLDVVRSSMEVVLVWSGDLPWKPVSVNAMYRGGNRRTYLSKEAREYKENVTNFARLTHAGDPEEGDLVAHIVHYFKDKRRRDSTNFHKAILDSLEGSIYIDDTQIKDAHLYIRKDDHEHSVVKIYKTKERD